MFFVSSTTSPRPEGQSESEELTLSDIIKNNKGKWAGIIVTARDKNFQPAKGKVVAVDLDRYLLRPKLVNQKDVCILFCGEPPYPLLL